jgi:hypothetical protein
MINCLKEKNHRMIIDTLYLHELQNTASITQMNTDYFEPFR